jgi:hypothetical protein
MADRWNEAAKALFDVFIGSTPNATYHPASGDSVDCRLYVSGYNRASVQYPEITMASLTGEVLASEVGMNIQAGEQVDYDGKTYVIAEPPRGDGEVWTLQLNLDAQTVNV